MRNRAHGKIHQILPVVKRYDPHIFRQRILLYIGNLILQRGNHFAGILPFPHHDDSLHNVVLFHPAYLSEARQARLVHIRQVLNQNRRPVDVLDHDVLDLLHIIDQPDTPDDIRLRTACNHVTAHINVTLGNGIIQLERRHAIVNQLVRVHAHLERLDLAAEADDVRHSGHSTQLPLDHPVLKRLQLAHCPFVTA